MHSPSPPPPPTTRHFAPAPFTPGRYSNTLARSTQSRHARQLIREDLSSSFTLELAPDGAATLCRNWRSITTNAGPEVNTEERIREQFGYRGRWSSEGDEVRVELTLDETVCAREGEYTNLVPNHAERWELVCRGVVRADGSRGDDALEDGPMLLCRTTFEAPRFGEDEPHLVGGVVVEGDEGGGGAQSPGTGEAKDGRWIVLSVGAV